MKWLNFVLSVSSAALALSVLAAEPVQRLSQFQWQNRVIVVDASGDAAPTLDVLRDNREDINERDIVWFVLDGAALHTNHAGGASADFAGTLRSQFRLKPGEAVLLGKDGGLKSRSPDLDTALLFALIDTMPMRQREMRERSD